eukprot:TRINITY_DN45407_c0_g1_i1.p1 TRINITY_DN45407_c0_g1~~TRINITY_DN45407_c0_g1_i1.p1  ORF type:complete len:179 (-),score=6.34 TRINITY_DN45407_c0_g1_i1:333-869(-)
MPFTCIFVLLFSCCEHLCKVLVCVCHIFGIVCAYPLADLFDYTVNVLLRWGLSQNTTHWCAIAVTSGVGLTCFACLILQIGLGIFVFNNQVDDESFPIPSILLVFEDDIMHSALNLLLGIYVVALNFIILVRVVLARILILFSLFVFCLQQLVFMPNFTAFLILCSVTCCFKRFYGYT